ncbi:rod-binding protein [Brevundimonas sp. 2R-24]|uniref:Rod-binding protein n=1 Tax=Peiella sedimenti TaxID=3061083 RepID=A0ABT8SMB8_9CAUL|nr:rod-binding protein [Caulobacteraceae bacterium XZ-24]
MSGPVSLPTDVLRPTVQAPAGVHDVARAREAAVQFETAFLSSMLQPVFAGVSSQDSMFGGGAGEEAFRSFMVDAVARQAARSGGIGLADRVQAELLRAQGLELPSQGAS